MFVKLQDAKSATAINIRNFYVITIRRSGAGYSLSVSDLPSHGIYQDLGTFPNLEQAQKAFDHLMRAMEDGTRYWDYWTLI